MRTPLTLESMLLAQKNGAKRLGRGVEGRISLQHDLLSARGSVSKPLRLRPKQRKVAWLKNPICCTKLSIILCLVAPSPSTKQDPKKYLSATCHTFSNVHACAGTSRRPKKGAISLALMPVEARRKLDGHPRERPRTFPRAKNLEIIPSFKPMAAHSQAEMWSATTKWLSKEMAWRILAQAWQHSNQPWQADQPHPAKQILINFRLQVGPVCSPRPLPRPHVYIQITCSFSTQTLQSSCPSSGGRVPMSRCDAAMRLLQVKPQTMRGRSLLNISMPLWSLRCTVWFRIQNKTSPIVLVGLLDFMFRGW